MIEAMDKIDTIVFDKTGTLTNQQDTHVEYSGEHLNEVEVAAIKSVTRESLHPLSQLITKYFNERVEKTVLVEAIENYIGKGTKATCNGMEILIGSKSLLVAHGVAVGEIEGSVVCIAINGVYKGKFSINHTYRNNIDSMVAKLKKAGYQLHLLSGDHPTEKLHLTQLLGADIPMLFEQNPLDKLQYIQQLQASGRRVMMVGDGLNDAGALQKCDVGIAVTDQTHLFTPASDGILEGSMIQSMDSLLAFAKKAKLIITLIFILSLLYNLVGMYFATRAELSPMVAAILMPISSISIVSLSALLSYLYAAPIRTKS